MNMFASQWSRAAIVALIITGVDGLRMGIDPNIKATKMSRRDVLHKVSSAVSSAAVVSASCNVASASAADENLNSKQIYNQRFPTLFDPIYGQSGIRRTIKKQIGTNIWSLEQNIQLGPLQSPLRCVVVQLEDESLWVHNPLAPTDEFFELVESCGSGRVGHMVASSYALEHKVFVKDALQRWPEARLWVSPGQFSFPRRSISNDFVFGKDVDGVLSTASDEILTKSNSELYSTNSIQQYQQPPWTREIQYETLTAGTFNIGGKPTTFYETTFFHIQSKSFIVIDAVAKISPTVPELNDPELLLLVSKRSTSDPQPEDTPENRRIGWEKTALLVSYFFPEHEEFDPDKLGVVTWTPGWHDNFQLLSNRLIVPPVVRTLLYAQNPTKVKEYVERVYNRWDFEQIVPAHFTAPIKATRDDFKRAFAFLDDDAMDAFPKNDLARGLRPIADLALDKLQ